MTLVTHTQRTIMEAIESLTTLDDTLRGKVENPGIMARVDALIEELTRLVGQVAQGTPGAAPDAATATQALAEEASVRGEGQRNADRC